MFAKRERLDTHWTRELKEMAADIDVTFLMWAANAASKWRFDGQCPVPVHHIHGAKDRVIPAVPHPEFTDGEPTLLNDGHLITWTSPEEVTRFIETALSQDAG